MSSIAFVADPITEFDNEFDTTAALMSAAQSLGYEIWHIHPSDLFLRQEKVFARGRKISNINFNNTPWYHSDPLKIISFEEGVAMVWMRKDPPFDMEYIYATYLLELLENSGVPVWNRPRALRDFNEKMAINHFPSLIPETLVSAKPALIIEFLENYQDIIVKPLNGRGGSGVFRLRKNDPNVFVTLEILTRDGVTPIMAQRYLSEVAEGDRRVLLVGGDPIPFVLSRFARQGETRANISAGGCYKVLPISEKEREIARLVKPVLLKNGLLLVGLDVIGGYLTEINVTSPMGIRQIETTTGMDIAKNVLIRAEKGVALKL